MKTKDYNPSILEVKFAEVLHELQDEISRKLRDFVVLKSEYNIKLDNPVIEFQVIDKDGDEHSLVIKVIQRPDDHVN